MHRLAVDRPIDFSTKRDPNPHGTIILSLEPKTERTPVNSSLHRLARRQWVCDALRRTTDHPAVADLMERLRAAGYKQLAYATVSPYVI